MCAGLDVNPKDVVLRIEAYESAREIESLPAPDFTLPQRGE